MTSPLPPEQIRPLYMEIWCACYCYELICSDHFWFILSVIKVQEFNSWQSELYKVQEQQLNQFNSILGVSVCVHISFVFGILFHHYSTMQTCRLLGIDNSIYQ